MVAAPTAIYLLSLHDALPISAPRLSQFWRSLHGSLAPDFDFVEGGGGAGAAEFDPDVAGGGVQAQGTVGVGLIGVAVVVTFDVGDVLEVLSVGRNVVGDPGRQ